MTESTALILAAIVTALLSLIGSMIIGLVAWGWKAEIATLRTQMDAFGVAVRSDMATLRAEVRASIAESVHELYRQINGSYVKTPACAALYNSIVGRVDGLENRVNDLSE